MTSNRRTPRVWVWICATAFLLGLVGIWTQQWWRNNPEDRPTNPTKHSGGENGTNGANGTNKMAPFRIVSEERPGDGNKVIWVERDGVKRQAILPEYLQMSPDELEEFAFPSGKPTPSFQRGPGRNPLLVFYGIAVDENTNALVGASIKADVMLGEPDKGLRRDIFNTTSGEDGRFELQIPWGQQMMITVTHTTNYISPPSQWFQFGPVGDKPIHVPDPNNPVTFEFQTRKPPETLFAFASRYRARPDGSPVRVDLTTGQIVEHGGDLIVSLRCPEPYTELKNFKWSASVQVADGGLIKVGNGETRMEFLHEAPNQGYSSGFQVDYGPDSPTYRRQYEGWYYVRSRGGAVYAKLRLDVNPFWDDRGVPFGISAVVNTNASRYLHTDP